jgi:hypothetical protein
MKHRLRECGAGHGPAWRGGRCARLGPWRVTALPHLHLGAWPGFFGGGAAGSGCEQMHGEETAAEKGGEGRVRRGEGEKGCRRSWYYSSRGRARANLARRTLRTTWALASDSSPSFASGGMAWGGGEGGKCRGGVSTGKGIGVKGRGGGGRGRARASLARRMLRATWALASDNSPSLASGGMARAGGGGASAGAGGGRGGRRKSVHGEVEMSEGKRGAVRGGGGTGAGHGPALRGGRYTRLGPWQVTALLH